MNVFLMALPHETRVLPGHTDETTIGREREENPFVRVWSGAEPEGTERVTVGGREATLVVWSPDYDGNGKAWVRFEDGEDAIVGGSWSSGSCRKTVGWGDALARRPLRSPLLRSPERRPAGLFAS